MDEPHGFGEPLGAPDAGSDSIEAVLAKGHPWLRFPTRLEVWFQADTLDSRRKWLMVCGFIGILSIYLGTANIAALNPDIVAIAVRVAHINVAASAFGLAVMYCIPKRWRRTWQAEGVTALVAIGTCAGLINGCLISRADTTFTHSAVLVSVVMYTCIAARQRFRWSLACTVLPFLAYLALVKGSTPQQELIVNANLKLMALSFVFALVANYTFEHRERHSWLLRKLEEQRRVALESASEHLHRLSIQDPLTGLFNRRHFDNELAAACSHALLARQSVAMLMIDVDFFKRYNDSYGHPAGDACLIQVGQLLTRVAQDHGGMAFRLGGEEFGMLLADRTLAQAMDAAGALCRAVRAANIEHHASTVARHVTVSVGVAQIWPAQDADAPALVRQADVALYQAKEGGRDQARTADVQDRPHDAPASHAGSPAKPEVSAAALIAQSVPAPEESAYLQTLQGQFRWLRFPSDQEAAYQDEHAAHRRRDLLIMSLVGMVIYQIYLLSSRAMFPDIQANAMPAQWGLSMTLLIMTVVCYMAKSLPGWWREAIFSFGASATAIMVLWILSQSQQLSALSFAAGLALIPMFAAVGAQQPFWFTFVPAVVTCVAAAWFLKPSVPLHTIVFHDTLLMIVNNAVFALILAYTLEHGARKGWLLSNIERLQGQRLLAATRCLHDLSALDPLTGIYNRRHFDNDFQRLWDEAVQDERPLAMLVIDVDFFKLYNDGYGHPVGDGCLKQVATTINQVAVACHGLAARLGGEEFGILLPGADVKQIVELGERVCAAVRRDGIEHRYTKVEGHNTVTVSVGAASLLPAKGGSKLALIAMADDALYQAKNLGRNRVAALRVP